MKELKVSQEFIIKQKNIFTLPAEYQIYDKNKQVGRIKVDILEFYNKFYRLEDWPMLTSTNDICEASSGKKLGSINILIQNFIFPISCGQILLGSKKYSYCPCGRFRLDFDIFENESKELVARYIKKGLFVKRDVVQFGSKIKKDFYPLLIVLLLLVNLKMHSK